MNVTRSQGAHLVEISSFDAWQLLAGADVARIAWHGPSGVSIVPVNCVLVDGALWFRTTPSASIARAGDGQEVAAEVDHLDPVARTAWSVVVRSVVELVDPQAAPDAVGELAIWPAGARSLYVRLEPTSVTGRRLQPRRPA